MLYFGALIRFGWDYYPTLLDMVMVRMELLLYSLQVIFYSPCLDHLSVRFKFQKLHDIGDIIICVSVRYPMGLTADVLPGMSNYSINFNTLICVGFTKY